MADEPISWEGTSIGLNLIGLGACIAAIFSTGGIAIIAGIIGFACLVGSMATSIIPEESPCERYCRECEEAPAIAAAEPGTSQGQEAGQSHHWRHSVAASRKSCRGL